MAERRIPSVVRDINVFVEGIGFLGQAESCKLPSIKTKVEVIAGQHVDTGMLEPMEAELEIRVMNPVIYSAITKMGESSIMLKGAFLENGQAQTGRASLMGIIEIDHDAWKMTDGIKVKIKMYVNVFHLELNDKEVIDINKTKGFAKFNGVDLYDKINSAIA